MTTPVQQIEALYQRLQRAREIVADGKVFPIVGMDDHYTVQGTGGHYLVNEHCTCQDAQQRNDMHKDPGKEQAVELYKTDDSIKSIRAACALIKRQSKPSSDDGAQRDFERIKRVWGKLGESGQNLFRTWLADNSVDEEASAQSE